MPAHETISTIAPPSIPWDRKSIVDWNYKLQSQSEVANYRFHDEGHVIATIGSRGPNSALAGPVYFWRVGPNGQLLISDDENGAAHTVLSLVKLDDITATTWNVQNATEEIYSRSNANR